MVDDWEVTLNQNNKGTNNNGETGENGTENTEEEDGPVENKFNEYTSYWDPKEQEFKMSTDTPVVRIFISREVVPELDEDGEMKDTIDLEEAAKLTHDMAVAYQENPDINSKNSTVVKLDGEQVLAMNAIDKLDLNNAPK